MKLPAFLASYRRRRRLIWAGLGLLVIASILDHAGVFGYQNPDRDRYGLKQATIVGTQDSNTLVVDLPDSAHAETKIKLYGIECPTGEEYFSGKAAEFIRDHVVGKKVRIALDPNHRIRDREGRLLVYLYFTDSGEMLNEVLLDRGLAYADSRVESVMKVTFSEHEKRASKAKAGRRAGENA